MNATHIKALRAVLERVVDLRAAGIDNYAKLGSVFTALREIAPDITTSHVADIGRFIAQDVGSEFELELDDLIGVIDDLIKQAEGRSQ